jgi:aminocarboxymuconate-semialdehyde decarboxylase
MTIDLHTHILPRTWPSWTARSGYAGWIELAHDTPGGGCARMCRTTSVDGSTPPQFFRAVDPNLWDPAARLAEMDRCGVAAQVLSTVPVMFSHWASPADAYDLHRLLNDHIAEVCRAHPTRFHGFAAVPMHDPALACRELERAVLPADRGGLGLRGVQIGTNIAGRNLDDPGVGEVLALAARLGACVFVHPWDMLAPERMERYWMPWLVGMPCETTIAMMSVLFGGVLERLRDLRIGFAHGGGSFPGTLGRIVHGFEARRDLFPDTCCDPREYLGKADRPARVWVDSLVHDDEALRLIVRLFSARRVCCGSDYPFPLGESVAGDLIRAAAWATPHEREAMQAGAAREFLGLPRA